MVKENKKISQLNIVIGLALIMLLVIVIITLKTGQEKAPVVVKEPEPEKPVVSKPRTPLPPFEEIEEERVGLTEEQIIEGIEEEIREEAPEAMMLKDLPVDLVVAEEEEQKDKALEQAIEQDAGTTSLKTQPSPEDIKQLQQKGLIIY